jgi:hypothetical protein
MTPTSGQCLMGSSSMASTAGRLATSTVKWHMICSRSIDSQASLGVPVALLPPASPSTGASLRAELAKENSSGGAATANCSSDSWPTSFVQRRPTTAATGSCSPPPAPCRNACASSAKPSGAVIRKPGWSSASAMAVHRRLGFAAFKPSTTQRQPHEPVLSPPATARAAPRPAAIAARLEASATCCSGGSAATGARRIWAGTALGVVRAIRASASATLASSGRDSPACCSNARKLAASLLHP